MKNFAKFGFIAVICITMAACKGGASRGTMDSTYTHPTDSTSTTVDTLSHQDTAKSQHTTAPANSKDSTKK
jgi:hypothetical protein